MAVPQSGVSFAGYSQVGTAVGTGSPFAPPPAGAPSFPSSQQHQQQQQQQQQMAHAHAQGYGPTAAAPHHMQQQHMQHQHNQQQQQQPALGGWVAGANQNVGSNINNGLTPPRSGDTVVAAPSQLPSSYSPSPPSMWDQSHVQQPPPPPQQPQQQQQHTKQHQVSKLPIRLVAVDEGAIHKQAQDFLMAMTVIQARLTSKGGGALSMAEEKLHRLEEATAKLRSSSAKHMRERARREEEGEGRQTVMRVLRTALAKAERTVASLREESRKHASQEEKKDKIIAELTRELQRRRKDHDSAHRDGGGKKAASGGAGDVARMAKEIDNLLERQAELEEQALVYQRKLLDLERGASPGKSVRKDRRTQVLEAQVDRAMGMELQLVGDVVRCEEERRRSEVKVMELEADMVRRSEAYEASLMMARAQNAELREKVEAFARERDATAESLRELHQEKSGLKNIISALQIGQAGGNWLSPKHSHEAPSTSPPTSPTDKHRTHQQRSGNGNGSVTRSRVGRRGETDVWSPDAQQRAISSSARSVRSEHRASSPRDYSLHDSMTLAPSSLRRSPPPSRSRPSSPRSIERYTPSLSPSLSPRSSLPSPPGGRSPIAATLQEAPALATYSPRQQKPGGVQQSHGKFELLGGDGSDLPVFRSSAIPAPAVLSISRDTATRGEAQNLASIQNETKAELEGFRQAHAQFKGQIEKMLSPQY